MTIFGWVGLVVAAACGGMARVVVDGEIRAWRSARGGDGAGPLGIAVVNVVGSLLLGVLIGAGATGDVFGILGTGFLGGFTTFSTAAVDIVEFALAGRGLTALKWGGGVLAAAFAAALCGLWLGMQFVA
ncbi:MAG TPA: CrcB family protein [Actinomycetaceae bacterium]|nr:CrcB family protein [Actinomycetaceae bacterium]